MLHIVANIVLDHNVCLEKEGTFDQLQRKTGSDDESYFPLHDGSLTFSLVFMPPLNTCPSSKKDL